MACPSSRSAWTTTRRSSGSSSTTRMRMPLSPVAELIRGRTRRPAAPHRPAPRPLAHEVPPIDDAPIPSDNVRELARRDVVVPAAILVVVDVEFVEWIVLGVHRHDALLLVRAVDR